MAQKQKTEKELVVSGAAAAAASPRRKSTAPRNKAAKTVTTLPVTEVETPALAPVVAATYCEPTYNEVAALAYSYWEARGCQGGSPEEDWLLAEQQLRTK